MLLLDADEDTAMENFFLNAIVLAVGFAIGQSLVATPSPATLEKTQATCIERVPRSLSAFRVLACVNRPDSPSCSH